MTYAYFFKSDISSHLEIRSVVLVLLILEVEYTEC